MNQQMLCTRGRASWQLGKAGSRLLCGKSLPVEESFWRIPFRQRVKKWLNRSIKAIFPIFANSLPLFKHLACSVLCRVYPNGILCMLILAIGNFSPPPMTCTHSAKGVIWQYCRWAVCILQLGSKICQVMALHCSPCGRKVLASSAPAAAESSSSSGSGGLMASRGLERAPI